MKLIREKSTNRVVYFLNDGDEVILTENNLSGTYTNLAVNSIDFELIEDVAPNTLNPQFGLIAYDGEYSAIDQTSYDANETEFLAQKAKEVILNEISFIENSITPRRTREAILGTDDGWLAEQEAAIALLRQQLLIG